MAKIKVGRAAATVDEETLEEIDRLITRVRQIHPNLRANWSRSNGYPILQFQVMLHHIVRPSPDGLEVDHINRDSLDARKANLRLASRAVNARNQQVRSDNSSGFKGVSWRKREKKFRTAITVQGKYTHLGYFETAEAAARAYDAEAFRLSGEYAVLNFPSEYIKEPKTNNYARPQDLARN